MVETLLELSPKLKMTYHFSRELTDLLDSHTTSEETKEKGSERIRRVIGSELTCFNYFIQRNSSGFMNVTGICKELSEGNAPRLLSSR